MKIKEVAETLGKTPRSVSNWIRWYHEGKTPDCPAITGKGRNANLSQEHVDYFRTRYGGNGNPVAKPAVSTQPPADKPTEGVPPGELDVLDVAPPDLENPKRGGNPTLDLPPVQPPVETPEPVTPPTTQPAKEDHDDTGTASDYITGSW